MAKTNRWMTEITKSFYQAAFLLISLLIIGTLGYELIEGWGLLESFYMTVITLSTVGFGLVHPLSQEGLLFTSVLIIVGMSVTVYAFGIIGQTALEGEFFKLRRHARMEKAIDQMSDHIIMCGFGRLGHVVADELRDNDSGLVVIEINEELIREIEARGIPYIRGNAHDDEMLLSAGIKRAKTLLALVPSDAENMFISLSAKTLNPNVYVVARTESDSSELKLRRAGADKVVSPYRASGVQIVQKILHQHVNDFLEIATGEDGRKLALEQVMIPEDSPIAGKTLEEAALRKTAGVNVAAMISPAGKTILNPNKDERIESGARIILFGDTDSFRALDKLMRVEA